MSGQNAHDISVAIANMDMRSAKQVITITKLLQALSEYDKGRQMIFLRFIFIGFFSCMAMAANADTFESILERQQNTSPQVNPIEPNLSQVQILYGKYYPGNDRDVIGSMFKNIYSAVGHSNEYAPWMMDAQVNLFYDTKWRMFNGRAMVDLNQEQLQSLRLTLYKNIDFDQLIHYRLGKGGGRIILLSAFDCPHCRRLEKYFTRLQGRLDADIFIVPSTLDPNNPLRKQTLYALVCSEDRTAVWHKMMISGTAPTPLKEPCTLARQKNDYVFETQLLGKENLGTPVWLFEDGKINIGVPSSEDKVIEMIKAHNRI